MLTAVLFLAQYKMYLHHFRFGVNVGFIGKHCPCWRGSHGDKEISAHILTCQNYNSITFGKRDSGGDWKWNMIIVRKRPGTQQNTGRGNRQPYGIGRGEDMDTLSASIWDLRGRRVDKLPVTPPLRAASVRMNGKRNILACACVSLDWKKLTEDSNLREFNTILWTYKLWSTNNIFSYKHSCLCECKMTEG